MKKILKRVGALALASCMVLPTAACGSSDKEEKATYTYNTYMEASPTCWNPHAWEMNADDELIEYLSMGLVTVQMKEEGVYEWVYEMADSVSDITATYEDKAKFGIGEDETEGRVWEVKLNKDAKWENGEAINADTYEYSMQQLLSPEMKNYRAGNYTSGTAAIANAEAYFNNDKAGQTNYTQATEKEGEKYFFNTDVATVFFGDDTMADYIEAGYESTYPSFAALKEYVGKGYVEVTDSIMTTLKALAVECGDSNADAWKEMVFVEDGIVAEMPWENVGFVKVDDYTFLYITEQPVDEFYLNTAFLTSWIVYEDLYEAGKTKTGDLVTTNYGTSADTYMACGPYKLDSFETDKQFILSQNENWYGYTDGKHEGLFETTTVKYQIVADHNTQLQLFNKGELDYIELSADDMSTYKMSENLVKAEQTYTFRWIFATDLEALKKLEVEANDGANKRVLSYKDFRKAISLSMDRNKFTTEATSAYKPAYGLIGTVYYYNVAEDPESIYRETEEAKKAVLNLYGVEYTDADYEAKYDAITGYDIEEARTLFQSVYEQAKADGNYTDGQAIKIKCCASAASSLSAEDIAQQDLLNDFVEAATVGTGFEGKITFEFEAGRENRYDDVSSGKIEMIRGAWGGAAFYPFQMMRCYTDAEYAGTIHESCGWDPATATVAITYDFDGDGTAETKEDTYYNWTMAINPGGSVTDMTAKLNVLAQLETAVLGEYQCVPWAVQTVCSLYSDKVQYVTTNYNVMYAFGGVRQMTYNYSDQEWEAYVKEQGGTLNYE